MLPSLRLQKETSRPHQTSPESRENSETDSGVQFAANEQDGKKHEETARHEMPLPTAAGRDVGRGRGVQQGSPPNTACRN